MKPKYKDFLTQEIFVKLGTLSGTEAPNFGLMTSHHMVEHLIFVTKSLMKRKGEPEGELTKSQLYFQKFITSGAPFQYRPKEDAKLNDIRTANIEEAIQILKTATEKFYTLFESNPTYKSYNSMMGEFNMAELELFNYQHGRWHLYQFGLIEDFAPLAV